MNDFLLRLLTLVLFVLSFGYDFREKRFEAP
jgi:hypothetical protein